MALDDDIRILSAVKLFESFTAEQLRLLAFGAEPMKLPQDRKLYREDDEADSAYIIVSGTILLYRENQNGRVPITTVGPGSVLGELALIADSRRLTSAAAQTDAEVIRLNRKMFRRILEEYPEAAQALYDRIAEDLHALIHRIETMAPKFAS